MGIKLVSISMNYWFVYFFLLWDQTKLLSIPVLTSLTLFAIDLPGRFDIFLREFIIRNKYEYKSTCCFAFDVFFQTNTNSNLNLRRNVQSYFLNKTLFFFSFSLNLHLLYMTTKDEKKVLFLYEPRFYDIAKVYIWFVA